MNYESPSVHTSPSPHHHHLLCWRSALAGLVLALLTFAGILSLAIAFGGIGLSDGSTVKNATIYTGVSIVAAMIIANFVGSYYSTRASRLKVDTAGVMQGLLVGSLFTLLILCQALSSAGTLGKAAASALGMSTAVATAGVTAASESTLVQEIIEDNLGDFKLRSNPDTVIKGLASRLIRGDQESAKNYLAFQAGVSRTEADQKIAMAKTKIDELATKAQESAASAMKATGWSLFVALVLATIASVLGGTLGAVRNAHRQIDFIERK